MPGQKFSRVCGTKIQLILGDARRRPEDKAWHRMPTAAAAAGRVEKGARVRGVSKRCGIVMCLACGWENYNKLCYDIRLFWSLLLLD